MHPYREGLLTGAYARLSVHSHCSHSPPLVFISISMLTSLYPEATLQLPTLQCPDECPSGTLNTLNPTKTELTILFRTAVPPKLVSMNGTAIYQARDPGGSPASPSPSLPPPVINEDCQFYLLNISGLSSSPVHSKPPLLSSAPLSPRHLSLEATPE